MEEIKRVLVAVDLTEMDETLVQYISMLSKTISLDKIYFIHVLRKMELPDEIIDKYPDLMAPLDETVKNEIEFTINQDDDYKIDTQYELKVVEGNRTRQILKWAKVKEVDLIVLGRKSGLEGEGIVSGKVVRLAPCSVVLVPEVLPKHLKKVVVPIDFSEASNLAFNFSIFMTSNIPDLSITCLNIYNVPSGYHTSGKSFMEFAELMKDNAKKSITKFIEKYNTKGAKIEAKFELDEKGHIAKRIYQFSVKEKASAIVVGSKGRTQAAAVLIGSVAEKLIKLNAQIPLIVVKERRHNMDFLEALLKI